MSDATYTLPPFPVRDSTNTGPLENDFGVVLLVFLKHARGESVTFTNDEKDYLRMFFVGQYPSHESGRTYGIYCNRDLHRTAQQPGDLKVSSIAPL